LDDWNTPPAGFAANGTNGTTQADASSSRQSRFRGRSKGKSGRAHKKPKTWWQQVRAAGTGDLLTECEGC
jgi:hypothetical protein